MKRGPRREGAAKRKNGTQSDRDRGKVFNRHKCEKKALG